MHLATLSQTRAAGSRAISFIGYRCFETISLEKPRLERYSEIEFALAHAVSRIPLTKEVYHSNVSNRPDCGDFRSHMRAQRVNIPCAIGTLGSVSGFADLRGLRHR